MSDQVLRLQASAAYYSEVSREQYRSAARAAALRGWWSPLEVDAAVSRQGMAAALYQAARCVYREEIDRGR